MTLVRSLIFNLIYLSWTIIFGILLMPTLLLSDNIVRQISRFYFKSLIILEKVILGLKYELRGTKNLPKNTPFIVAMKHQSAWETLKLMIWFEHPVVILKKELLHIPVWGWYAQKCGMIGIDRSSPINALNKTIHSTKKALTHGKVLVLFPEGTRVPINSKKTYKSGVIKLAQELQIPLIPAALNSGLYWPKNSFFKHSGTIIVEFLPAFNLTTTSDIKALTKQLETQIETKTNELVKEGKHATKN